MTEQHQAMFEGMASKTVLHSRRNCQKFTRDDWYKSAKERQSTAERHHQLAERILAESERLIEETADDALKNRREVDHQLEVKIKDIEFTKEQLEKQKKLMDQEIDALTTYKERIQDNLKALGTNASEICNKCLFFRENRLGVDLCIDDVELELLKEIEIIQGVTSLLKKTLEQVNEQIRKLKAKTYTLSRDLLDKANVLLIDKYNLRLNEKSLNLSLYHGCSDLDPATITEAEWSAHTQANIDAGTKELNTCIPLRSYVDAILKQVVEDLWAQNDAVTEAFRRRIEEYKFIKSKMEKTHFETVRQIDEMKTNIGNLEKSIAEKEKFMALAHTRLGNRCQRENTELCRDEAEGYLVDEVHRIKDSVVKLQQILAESNATLRYLLRTQIQLEEEINIKNNSIKIDEVDCLTLRRSIDYRAY